MQIVNIKILIAIAKVKEYSNSCQEGERKVFPTGSQGGNDMSKRDEVRAARMRAAEDMAARKGKGEVTPESVKEAARLLQRCLRFSLAYQRHCEGETINNHNKDWFIHEDELLEKRWERLDKELREYRMFLYCCGYYCVNVYEYDYERHLITSNGYLHFFD